MCINESLLNVHFRVAIMSNTTYMSVFVRKKGLALTFTGSNEAQLKAIAPKAFWGLYTVCILLYSGCTFISFFCNYH